MKIPHLKVLALGTGKMALCLRALAALASRRQSQSPPVILDGSQLPMTVVLGIQCPLPSSEDI